MIEQKISIRGAHEHYLKSIDLDLPHHQLIVVTGVSGCGKSSLVVDTLYREGRRRYLDFVSEDIRDFAGDLSRPRVNSIEGLPPVFFPGTDASKINRRSTVGTLIDVQDLLRLLFSRAGSIFCYSCAGELKRYSSHEIVSELLWSCEKRSVLILAPIPSDTSWDQLRKEGFVRVRSDGRLFELGSLDIPKGQTFQMVIDRVMINRDERSRLTESVELALKYGRGVVQFASEGCNEDLSFSNDYRCLKCQIHYGSLPPAAFSFNSPYGACLSCHGLGFAADLGETCSKCHGRRLNLEALAIRIGQANIFEMGEQSVQDLLFFFKKLKFKDAFRQKIYSEVSAKMIVKLDLLVELGLSYLSLNRRAHDLSSGELQRVRLVAQMASGLVGVLYVLDEPTSGLHPNEVDRLLKVLFKMRDQGNTVIVIEHDESVIRSADKIVELGPGAGPQGGSLIAFGGVKKILSNANSVTKRLLENKIDMGSFGKRISPHPDSFLIIQGACAHNLKNIDVKIPLGVFCCITGPSGAGKSSLIQDVLVRVLDRDITASQIKDLCQSVQGKENIDQCVQIDSEEMGRSSRSTTATYIGILDQIRELFANVPESRIRGYASQRFSFNVQGGRCEACSGQGIREVEMVFLPDLEMPCDVCQGQRYNPETLEVKFKGKNISEILQMTLKEAYDFFKNISGISQKLEPLLELGLGYLVLGQNAKGFSQGEAQRLKLSTFLSMRIKKRTLFVFDEPTRGLHLVDIAPLMKILFRLRDQGHSILVIEHHLNVIEQADHVIDLGPGAGKEGGRVVGEGTPEEVSKIHRSSTGRLLKIRLKTVSQQKPRRR